MKNLGPFVATSVVAGLVVALVACHSSSTENQEYPLEKSCACNEPRADNAVSIDLPIEFVPDKILGDSIQNMTVYRHGQKFVKMIVRCGDCDTIKRSSEGLGTVLPPLLRKSVRGELLKTKKFEGKWFEKELYGTWDFEFFLNGVGPKDWYVQVIGESVDSNTMNLVKEAISTIEIREKAYRN